MFIKQVVFCIFWFTSAIFSLNLFLGGCSTEKPAKSSEKPAPSDPVDDPKTLEALAQRQAAKKHHPTNTDQSHSNPENPEKKQDPSSPSPHEEPSTAPVPAPVPVSDEAPVPPSENVPPPTPSPQPDPILQIHQNKPAECAGCHEKKRPSLTHYPKNDCSLCHQFPSFKGGNFLHDPKPPTCESCHPRPQTAGLRSYPNQGPPQGFDPNDAASLGGGHYRGKDCVSCHQTKKEGAPKFLYTHSTPNPGICLPCHFNQGLNEHQNSQGITLLGLGNCNSCHLHFDAKVRRDFVPGAQ